MARMNLEWTGTGRKLYFNYPVPHHTHHNTGLPFRDHGTRANCLNRLNRIDTAPKRDAVRVEKVLDRL